MCINNTGDPTIKKNIFPYAYPAVSLELENVMFLKVLQSMVYLYFSKHFFFIVWML